MQRTLLVCAIAFVTVGFEAGTEAGPQQQFTTPQTAPAQRRAVARPPTLSRLSTSPPRPLVGQPFTFAATGVSIADQLVEVVFTGPGCNPCVVPNEVLTAVSETRVVGPATLNTPGTYYVSLRHGASAAMSNNVALTIGDGPSAAGPTAGLSLTSVRTSPATPSAAQSFDFILNGGDLTRRGTQVVITGPGCDPCVVPNVAMTARSATRLTGRATLNQPGIYSIAVREGPNGTVSRGLQISVSAPPPSITGLTTSPPRPMVSDAFTFRVNGANIDGGSVQVIFTGPGCSPCVVPASDIDAATPTRVVGQAHLQNPGTYQIALRHGAASPPSASVPVTVGGGGPTISRLITMPANPRPAEVFNYRLTGTGITSTMEVVVTGPGCSPCVIGSNALNIDPQGRITGSANLIQPGRYEFSIRDGSTGAPSGGVEVMVR